MRASECLHKNTVRTWCLFAFIYLKLLLSIGWYSSSPSYSCFYYCWCSAFWNFFFFKAFYFLGLEALSSSENSKRSAARSYKSSIWCVQEDIVDKFTILISIFIFLCYNHFFGLLFPHNKSYCFFLLKEISHKRTENKSFNHSSFSVILEDTLLFFSGFPSSSTI